MNCPTNNGKEKMKKGEKEGGVVKKDCEGEKHRTCGESAHRQLSNNTFIGGRDTKWIKKKKRG